MKTQNCDQCKHATMRAQPKPTLICAMLHSPVFMRPCTSCGKHGAGSASAKIFWRRTHEPTMVHPIGLVALRKVWTPIATQRLDL